MKSLQSLLLQSRKFTSSQLKMHEEERRSWEKERASLHNRIRELEETVSNLLCDGVHTDSITIQGISPTTTLTLSPYSVSHATSPPIKGERPFWMGPETDAARKSERSSEVQADSLSKGLPSIPEDSSPPSKKSVAFHEDAKDLPKLYPSHESNSTAEVQKSPVGQGFTKGHKPYITMPASIPHASKPSIEPRPKVIDIPSANLLSESLYTIDAGHTPLTHIQGEENLMSAVQSPEQKGIENEQPPYEPAPSVRPPKERSDSYFPEGIDDQRDGVPEAPEDDPALKPPYSLSSNNTKAADSSFLDKVNSELEHQILHPFVSGLPDNEESGEVVENGTVKEESTLDKESAENTEESQAAREGPVDGVVKLRVKRSMNFGAPLGKLR